MSRVDSIRSAAEFRARQAVLRTMRLFSRPATTRAALSRLASHSTGIDVDERPIFVLGAGWRTGSTFLQRTINTQPDTLLWGEPFNDGSIVPRLAASLRFLDPDRGRFHSQVLDPASPLPGDHKFTATLSPGLEDLVAAYRQMLDRLWREPAVSRGCSRWGAKEVVWDRDCIDLLRLLYPGARFVLLVRDPLPQWRSYRPWTRRPWYYRWPDSPVGSPVRFGRMWRDLVDDFVSADREYPNVLLVRYEDLRSPEVLERLAQFLDLPEPIRTDLGRVGSSQVGQVGQFYTEVPRWERAAVRRLTSRGRRQLDYR